jgi:hypothetical protein
MQQLGFRWTNLREIWNLNIFIFFENLSRKFKFYSNLTRITGTLREDQYTFVIISGPVLLRMRNVSDKRCRANQNTHFMFNNFFRKSCRLWDNVEKYGRTEQDTHGIIRHISFACWITKATDTLRICNTCFFSAATVVTWTRSDITLYAHYLTCYTRYSP